MPRLWRFSNRWVVVFCLLAAIGLGSGALRKALLAPAEVEALKPVGLPLVVSGDAQAVFVHLNQLRKTLDYLGNPLPEETSAALDSAARHPDAIEAVRMVQEAMDPLCLVGIHINPESRVKVEPGLADRVLVKNDGRPFLVKVHNQAGVTAPLRVGSPQARKDASSAAESDRWLELEMHEDRPLPRSLSGLELEYRLVTLSGHQAGKRAAVLSFDVGQGTQDIGFRNDVTLTFKVREATPVTLEVLDEQGRPTTAAFEIRNAQGRTYPAQWKRLPPDFSFHPQVYRSAGEVVELPPGTYTFKCTRGPEYFEQVRTVEVAHQPQQLTFELVRWIDPASMGWWSGDHHIHAAGCKHYDDPAKGITPSAMIRHALGEDLKVGAVLNWGPGFDYQKQFFTGRTDAVSQYPYLLRYDVEVAGFGSQKSGHLCLLRLREQSPPGGDGKTRWPTLGLNTLRWAKKQGAVVGPAHTGWGLQVESDELPNYEVPPFDSIGANEYIVDVTHMVPGEDGALVPAVDFLSMCDTPPVWELNMWYHTLNVGFRTRISGETDFPCIFGERVGLGRSYVHLDGELTYNQWCENIRQGRNYVSDGRSHIIGFGAGGVEMGRGDGELRLDGPNTIRATAKIAALLPAVLDATIDQGLEEKPYWHIEKARIGDSRKVKVELVVNGHAAAHQLVEADGELRDLAFDVEIQHSSWIAMRIFPSSHTNPVFVLVDDKPIRASRRSAEWCLKGVDQCWSQKERFIRESEIEDALKAYEHARQTYRRIILESEREVKIQPSVFPTSFELYPNYPNPFNSITNIRFDLPVAAKVSLEIFNSLGQRVESLIDNQPLLAGRHTLPFDAGDLSSNVYFYRLSYQDRQLTRSMTLLK